MYVSINSHVQDLSFFPCHPHQAINEYHSICCRENLIMYVWNIFEVKDDTIIRPVVVANRAKH